MASGGAVAVSITLLVLSMQGVFVLGRLECKDLPVEFCAFSVSSSGARCVLEKKYSLAEGSPLYHCKSSAVMAQKSMEWIESEKCLEICGLRRMVVGMSTDDLNEYSDFSYKLCSDNCQSSCPNVADLYLTLTANQGLYLPHLCEAVKKGSRRLVLQNENGNGNDVDNENENWILFAPPPAPMMINELTPAPAPMMISALTPAPAPMMISALTPAPSMNAPMSGPAPAIIDALTPAPTMGAD